MTMEKTKRICGICGKEYMVRSDRAEQSKFCSSGCLNEAKRKPAIVKCEVCDNEFEVKQCRAETAKYCSLGCKYSALSKKMNKRVERYCAICGKKFAVKRHRAQEVKYCSRECMTIAYNQDGLNPNWKGDSVGYRAVHDWVRKNKPKPMYCERCGIEAPYDLANISGGYRRDIADYEWLCRRCHMTDDGRLRASTKRVIEAGKTTRFR
jgi:endogenous inhibitor of DNA gyrase (YacG/DUF329 family)